MAWAATEVSSDANSVGKKKLLCLSRTCLMAAVPEHQGFEMGVKQARDEMMLENIAVLPSNSRCAWGFCGYWRFCAQIHSVLKAARA